MPTTPRRLVRLVPLVLVLALLAAACGEEGEDGQETTEPTGEPTQAAPIRIGLLTYLSGPFVSFGSDIQAAVNLAVDEINAAGGVNGSILEIVVFDSPGEPEQAVLGTRQLAEDGAVAIIGPVSSGEAEVAFTETGPLEVPMITGTANKEGITELGGGWAFRNTATNTQLYQVVMPAYTQAYGVTRVALAYDEQEPFAVAAAQFALPAVAGELGVEIADTVTFQRGQTDFTALVQRLGEADVEGVFVMGGPVESGLLSAEMGRQGLDLPVMGHVAHNSSAFRESSGGSIGDWVVPSLFYAPMAGEKGQAFAEAMSGLDQEPPTVPEAANYYDIVYMIAGILSDAGMDGSTDLVEARHAIRDGLLALSGFDGAAGPTSFLENGDALKQIYSLLLNMEGADLLG